MANQFEKDIIATFEELKERAHLWVVYPPMRAAGLIGKMPGFIPVGKGDYDFAGYYIDGAISIGVEVKETKDYETRLPVVKPGAKGNGLQYGQLRALVRLHKAGGMALLLWSNGGMIGRFDGQRLAAFSVAYDASLRAEAGGKEVAKGGRSIEWSAFEKVTERDWLPPVPRPALSPLSRKLLADVLKNGKTHVVEDD